MTKRIPVVLVTLVAALAISAASASASSSSGVQTVVRSFLPGATATLSRDHLRIALPATDAPRAGESTLEQNFTSYDLGWRGEMAAGVINRYSQISRYTMRVADGDEPAGWRTSFHGTFINSGPFAPSPDLRLGRLSPPLALRQLDSSLAVIRGVMPRDADLRTQVTLIPSGVSRDRFALEVDVNLAYRSGLRSYLGDILNGLKTGLIGSTHSLIMGIAIEIKTADGGPLIGIWESVEPSAGAIGYAQQLNGLGDLLTDATFPNLTGGPRTTTDMVLSAG